MTAEATMRHPTASRSSSRGRATPFRLAVLAVDTVDLVWAAGGLIFDSAHAGWIVDAYLETACHDRALRILGAKAYTLPAAFDREEDGPDAVFLAAALYDRHRGAQRFAADTARRHGAQVGVWDQVMTTGDVTDGGLDHRLSRAARAFKIHALTAAGLSTEVAPIEPFRNGRGR